MPLFHKYTRHFNMSKMFTNTLFLPDSLYSFTALALLNESHTNYIVRPLWCFNVTKPSPPSFLFLRKALKSWWISFICPCVLLPAHIWAVAEDSLGVSADNPSPSFTSWSISYQLLEPADCTHRSHIHQLSPPCSSGLVLIVLGHLVTSWPVCRLQACPVHSLQEPPQWLPQRLIWSRT